MSFGCSTLHWPSARLGQTPDQDEQITKDGICDSFHPCEKKPQAFFIYPT